MSIYSILIVIGSVAADLIKYVSKTVFFNCLKCGLSLADDF